MTRLPLPGLVWGWLLALVPILLLLVVSAAPPGEAGHAQEPGGPEIRIVDVDDSSFPRIRVVLEIEQEGRPLAELARNDLVVRESGEGATVSSVVRATDASIPMALVIALDTSGSVSGDTLARSQDAAALLVQNLADADSAALISFSEQAQLIVPLGASKAAVVDAIRSLQATGDTALYDAVVLSANAAASADPGTRRAVVLLSDGEDFGGISTSSRESTLATAEGSGVVFYVIGVGTEVDRAFLEELARVTGGKYYSAPGPDEITTIYGSLSEFLRGQFVVEIESTADPGPGQRSLTLSLVTDTVTTIRIDYMSRQASATPTPEPATATPSPQPASPTPTPPPPTPGATTRDDGSVAVLPALGIGAVLLLAVGAVFTIVIRRRRPLVVLPHQSAEGMSASRRRFARPAGTGAILVVNGEPRVIPATQEPFVAGAAPECLIELPADRTIAPVHARFWWRDGKLMVHHLAPGLETLVDGKPVQWVSLADGDEVRIGPHTLVYHTGSSGAASTT